MFPNLTVLDLKLDIGSFFNSFSTITATRSKWIEYISTTVESYPLKQLTLEIVIYKPGVTNYKAPDEHYLLFNIVEIIKSFKKLEKLKLVIFEYFKINTPELFDLQCMTVDIFNNLLDVGHSIKYIILETNLITRGYSQIVVLNSNIEKLVFNAYRSVGDEWDIKRKIRIVAVTLPKEITATCPPNLIYSFSKYDFPIYREKKNKYEHKADCLL
jgi:hypothetical protein